MYGFKILCEISKMPFGISHKILNLLTNYDILELWQLKS